MLLLVLLVPGQVHLLLCVAKDRLCQLPLLVVAQELNEDAVGVGVGLYRRQGGQAPGVGLGNIGHRTGTKHTRSHMLNIQQHRHNHRRWHKHDHMHKASCCGVHQKTATSDAFLGRLDAASPAPGPTRAAASCTAAPPHAPTAWRCPWQSSAQCTHSPVVLQGGDAGVMQG